jgi:hypothetical protein
LPYVHSIKIDRKTGEIINYKITKSEEKINHKPLINLLYNHMEREITENQSKGTDPHVD